MRGRNRARVKARIRDIARDEIFADEPVTVTYSLDSMPAENGYFVLGQAEGANEPEDLSGRIFTDRFVVKARIESHGHETAEDAEVEVERLLALFEDGIGTPSSLSHPTVDFDNDPDTGRPYFDGVQTPYLGQVDGPQSGPIQTGSPIVGWADFDIECRCNIQRST